MTDQERLTAIKQLSEVGVYGDDLAWLIQQIEAKQVRCGECRHWDAYEDDAIGFGHCMYEADAITVSGVTDTRSDFGCIFGERKAGE